MINKDKMRVFKPYLPNFNDILIFIGTAMAGRGIYAIYKPAMWIAIGVFMVYLGWPKRAVK